ncbi:hypothetical protein B0H17DRAFT_1103925 [Mycena rosella]|uniref:Uncharacterized protein n=1 Tax=Mycena rosella TaxID=1033263 RepID=A0AAD7CF49_MYCRO|nr:hypothetical protein B0H17DRAFT_1103925 [Mycena rosella]
MFFGSPFLFYLFIFSIPPRYATPSSITSTLILILSHSCFVPSNFHHSSPTTASLSASSSPISSTSPPYIPSTLSIPPSH